MTNAETTSIEIKVFQIANSTAIIESTTSLLCGEVVLMFY